jgi:hypothetical protein
MKLSFYQCYHILMAVKKGAKCRQYYIRTQQFFSCEDPSVVSFGVIIPFAVQIRGALDRSVR